MKPTITAMHYCLPPTRLTNQQLVERFGERQVRSIVRMAGVNERRVVSSGQTASDLAYCAATRLLEDRGIDRSEIDLLIFASQTGDYQIPATACVLHGRLKLSERCAAFDIGMGCSGFPYALSAAHGMIASGTARKALVINAEALSAVIHPGDRGLVPLHGDAAVVSLVEPATREGGIIGFFLGTKGDEHEHLMIPASGARMPRNEETKREIVDESGSVRTLEHLHMNGPAVFHFSVYKVPEVIKQALVQFRLAIDDFDLVILHQANRMMVDQIYKALDVPEDKRFYFMETVGNASGASSPLALAEAWRQGRIRPGTRTLLAAFGVGFSWGVTAVHWPADTGPAVQSSVEFEDGL